MANNEKIRIGITHGDINGVGYEVILNSLDDPRMPEVATAVVYGSARIAGFYRHSAGLPDLKFNIVNDADDLLPDRLNFINVIPEEIKVEPGVATREAGECARLALERAVSDLNQGKIDAIITAPINKDTIHSDKFPFTGHTEYLQSVWGLPDGSRALMIMASNDLRIACATGHLPVKDVSKALSVELIAERLLTLNASLVTDFEISSPRIAVLALNPHAGENGLLGKEEAEIIAPAMEQARAEGVLCFGPYAADGFFGSGNWKKFDGILAMYHDQGLIPFKMLAMDSGINFTAGLPFVRTSPDHGTAYDLAGKNAADCGSMRAAIYSAVDIVASRRRYDEFTANPLQKQMRDNRRDE